MNAQRVFLGLIVFIVGCAGFTRSEFIARFGEPSVRERLIDEVSQAQVDYWQDVKPILDDRCVVCHGCYDAPCQLKLTAIEGVERGANKEVVYSASRVVPAMPSRLFQDEQTVQRWRQRGFFPVLNEFDQTESLNAQASVFYQLLDLKRQYPLPTNINLDEHFTFGLARKNSCPNIDELKGFVNKNPLWGMPYALPAVSDRENKVLMDWLTQGARYTPRGSLSSKASTEIKKWESFLNRPDNKSQLMSRYLYEHLFLAHLYFDDSKPNPFFRLIRSSSPPGAPAKIIATRRPYDDPLQKVYYRLVPEYETVVAKTHLPYQLNAKRMANWQAWFLDAPYTVKQLPSYGRKISRNPFEVFKAIPSNSRYRFLLDEAQFTIMNFIKGPVCRGQVAVNVIRDHFWIFFINPDVEQVDRYDEFLADNHKDFDMPNTNSTLLTPMTTWGAYADKQSHYLAKRDAYLASLAPALVKRDMDLIWSGDGVNPNAALTVFRHLDNATVKKGMLGGEPKTAWVIDYALLERIFYLLAASYDVYGNAGHQLISRVYMDFLRMEGELNFLYFLPAEARDKERLDWYQGAESRAMTYMATPLFERSKVSLLRYKTQTPKMELFNKIKVHTQDALSSDVESDVSDVAIPLLQTLSAMTGKHVALLPEFSVLEVNGGDGIEYYSIIKNNGHKNISTMFEENDNLLPKEHSVSVLKGLAGSYPNAFFSVKQSDLGGFVTQVMELGGESDYQLLRDDFGIRRTDVLFWEYSDRLHDFYKKTQPIDAGILDYNRLESR